MWVCTCKCLWCVADINGTDLLQLSEPLLTFDLYLELIDLARVSHLCTFVMYCSHVYIDIAVIVLCWESFLCCWFGDRKCNQPVKVQQFPKVYFLIPAYLWNSKTVKRRWIVMVVMVLVIQVIVIQIIITMIIPSTMFMVLSWRWSHCESSVS